MHLGDRPLDQKLCTFKSLCDLVKLLLKRGCEDVFFKPVLQVRKLRLKEFIQGPLIDRE
jgi:hypothetical protein